MTTQLYLQKAEMQLSRGLEEKALESLLAALACQDRDTVSETQMRCLLGEYQFVHQQYVQAQEQFSWISDRAEQLEHDYDRENLDDPSRRQSYHGPVTTDRYGRKIPKHAVGTENFHYTSSASDLLRAVTALYDRIVNPNLLIRRLSISANKLLPEADSPKDEAEQLDLFTDYAAKERREQADEAAHARERKIQEAMLGIKKKYGKNAILKGMNLEEGATARERNETIGGHHA